MKPFEPRRQMLQQLSTDLLELQRKTGDMLLKNLHEPRQRALGRCELVGEGGKAGVDALEIVGLLE